MYYDQVIHIWPCIQETDEVRRHNAVQVVHLNKVFDHIDLSNFLQKDIRLPPPVGRIIPHGEVPMCQNRATSFWLL